MNERIKELAVLCWKENPYGPPWFEYEKFTELLTEECLNEIVNDRWRSWSGSSSGEWNAGYDAGTRIRWDIQTVPNNELLHFNVVLLSGSCYCFITKTKD